MTSSAGYILEKNVTYGNILEFFRIWYLLSEKTWTSMGILNFGFIGKVKKADWGEDCP
jgi:hypothetical protein